MRKKQFLSQILLSNAINIEHFQRFCLLQSILVYQYLCLNCILLDGVSKQIHLQANQHLPCQLLCEKRKQSSHIWYENEFPHLGCQFHFVRFNRFFFKRNEFKIAISFYSYMYTYAVHVGVILFLRTRPSNTCPFLSLCQLYILYNVTGEQIQTKNIQKLYFTHLLSSKLRCSTLV